MIASAAIVVGLVLTLVLPIYPKGIDPMIAAFLGIAGVAGLFGLLRRAARRELLVLSLWGPVLLLGIFVGAARHGDSRQALEDTLPYLLFVLGLVAGRGVPNPRTILVVTLWVCVADSFISLWLMPQIDLSIRSTYTYPKITAGLPLVGMYLSTLLRHGDPGPHPPSLFRRPTHAAIYALMLVALVLSVSRGMILGYALGIVVTAYIRKPSHVLLGGILVTLAAVVYSSTFSDIGTQYLRTDQASTIEGRFREIEAAWDAFVMHPLIGEGLGASFEVDGHYRSYVHNMAAYHLWKFGLIGSILLALPILAIGRELRSSPRILTAIAIGGGASIVAYLVTCAGYKTYYLVWMYGVVAGATLSWLGQLRALAAARARTDGAAPHA